MKLGLADIGNVAAWQEKGYNLPEYDVEKVWDRTREKPEWLHFGAGNIFRAYPAVLQQQLLNRGLVDTGIILCECFDEEIIDEAYEPYSNISVAVTLKASGEVAKEVVGSIAESIKLSSNYARLLEIIRAESLQLVTFTITEKGYTLRDNNGDFFPWIRADLESFEQQPGSIIGVLTKLLYAALKVMRCLWRWSVWIIAVIMVLCCRMR